MNRTFDDVTVLGKIIFSDGKFFNSSSFISLDNVVAFERNSMLGYTSLLQDHFVVNQSITTNTFLSTPLVTTTSIEFLSDVNESGEPNIQTRAFTDIVNAIIQDNSTKINAVVPSIIDTSLKKAKINTAEFLTDLDGDGLPKVQSKAFTDAINTTIQDNKTSIDSLIPSLIEPPLKRARFSEITSDSNMILNPTGSIDCQKQIIMSNVTSGNRNITSSLFALTDNVASYTGTKLVQFYHSTASTYLHNMVNSGTLNFVVKNSGGTDITPLTLSATTINVPTNISVTMSSGTGVYNQSNVAGATSSFNTFKRSNVFINSNSLIGSSTSAMEVYDEINGKGLFILPNASSGALTNSNMTNDCCLTSRATQNSNALSLSNWNTNLRNGIRIYTTDIDNCGLLLQCGQYSTNDYTEFKMSYNRTSNTTVCTFNNSLDFNPSSYAPSRRNITGIGTLSFTDILNNTAGGTTKSTIKMDSVPVVPGMFYECGLDAGYHIFSAKDSGGTLSSPVFIGASLSSFSNIVTIRNSTTTSNRFDISTDSSNNTNIRARSTTNSTNALININCDSVNGSGTVTNNAIATISPSYFEFKKPIQINYSTSPSTLSHLGYLASGDCSSQIPIGGVTSSSSIRNQHQYSITSGGTYLIQWGISVVMDSGTATFTALEFGIATTATNTFDSYTQTYPSYIKLDKILPSLTTVSQFFPTSCCVRFTSSGTIYFNYLANYTGGTKIIPGGYFSIARVG